VRQQSATVGANKGYTTSARAEALYNREERHSIRRFLGACFEVTLQREECEKPWCLTDNALPCDTPQLAAGRLHCILAQDNDDSPSAVYIEVIKRQFLPIPTGGSTTRPVPPGGSLGLSPLWSRPVTIIHDDVLLHARFSMSPDRGGHLTVEDRAHDTGLLA
jgi:hypothetical protein